MAKFVITKNNTGEYWWILKARNSETICISGMYKSLAGCKKGICAVKRCSLKAPIIIKENRTK